VLREKLFRRGIRSWFNLLKHFLSCGSSETITKEDLMAVLRDLRFDLELEQLKQLCSAYDLHKDGSID